MIKTNAMRKLDTLKINYEVHCYAYTEAISGVAVAAVLGQNPAMVFKTLVTVGKTGINYVFVIPAEAELDLKKAAQIAGEKAIEMLKAKDLLPLTGYVHGGCSPIGMKKPFKTFVHNTAAGLDAFFVSGGKIGYQLELAPDDLNKAIPLVYGDLIK